MAFRSHPALDNSSVLESEEIPFNSSGFLDDLQSDMGICSVAYLSKAYPELAFTIEHTAAGRRPRGYDLVVDVKGSRIWMTARWKTVAETLS